MKETNENKQIPEYLTSHELADRLRMSVRNLNRWQARRRIPQPIQVGHRGRRLWDWSKVLKSLN